MSATNRIMETFQKAYAGVEGFKEFYKQRLIQWRKEEAITRVKKPTNPVRARELGYKAKQGFIIVRVRVRKGSGKHTRPNKGRRPSRMGVRKLKRRISIQVIAEQRAARKYPNLEVLNSYWVGEDGQHKWYEVIMIDPTHPAILNDKEASKIVTDTRRVFRGRTSAGKKSRGLR